MKVAEKHPRECGEYLIGAILETGAEETPPRVRGIPKEKSIVELYGRNTPASAGNTVDRRQIIGSTWKHPRECGEYPVT